MNWEEVRYWLERHGHINSQWERIEVSTDGIYCEDASENTIISIFTKVSGELVVFIGMLKPKTSIGGETGVYVESHWDVCDYLVDNMERLIEKLEDKWNESIFSNAKSKGDM